MTEIFQFEFMRNALYAGILASILCGVIGVLIVVNRLVFISGGLAHSAYGGIGLAFFFGFPPVVGAVGFAFVMSIVMGLITYDNRGRADTVIGALWAVGMALGIILIDITPGYNVDLMSYLFGSLLAVSKFDLYLMVCLTIVICLIVGVFYKDFLAMSYDDEFAKLRNRSVKILYFLLLSMISVAVVMIIRVVGLILVMALFTIPPYITEKYAKSLGGMMVYSFMLSLVFVLVGLGVSYYFNITSGASIIMVAATCFFLFIGVKSFSSHSR